MKNIEQNQDVATVIETLDKIETEQLTKVVGGLAQGPGQQWGGGAQRGQLGFTGHQMRN